MHRYLITGTDTDVGKTRVTAALALALRIAGENPTVVKLVQTGLDPGVPGDAVRAATLAKCRHVELARFRKAADPWSAALADGLPAAHAEDLARALDSITGAVVAEGAGGLAVPLNRVQNFGNVAAVAKLRVILVVGLRLGCMNHALLTLALCDQLRVPVAGAVLVERWERTHPSYADDVRRALQGKIEILGIVPFDLDEAASVEDAAQLFIPLL
ncbi:MAG TPA: dethiobiotin synthase [Candidatus Baltobacteraceae bacterium]|nr:dethiobiotin synthase [Candidatus Baltobacteraceae bacterium]